MAGPDRGRSTAHVASRAPIAGRSYSGEPHGPAQCRAVREQQVCIRWMRSYDTTAETGRAKPSGRVRCSTPKT